MRTPNLDAFVALVDDRVSPRVFDTVDAVASKVEDKAVGAAAWIVYRYPHAAVAVGAVLVAATAPFASREETADTLEVLADHLRLDVDERAAQYLKTIADR